MKFLLAALLIASFSCYGQSAKFSEIKLKSKSDYYTNSESSIIYPIINSGNKKIDSLINFRVKIDLLFPDDESQDINDVLAEDINDYGLTDLTYKVTYNGYGLLSFIVFIEGCGAYCSSSYIYLNFDLKTGKKLEITDLIKEDKIDSFKQIVFAKKIKTLNQYKMEELNSLKENDIDTATYDWVMKEINSCIEEVNIDNFSLSSSSLEIMDICGFPHAIRSQEPDFELKYDYTFLKKFLRPEFKKKLLK